MECIGFSYSKEALEEVAAQKPVLDLAKAQDCLDLAIDYFNQALDGVDTLITKDEVTSASDNFGELTYICRAKVDEWIGRVVNLLITDIRKYATIKENHNENS